jgi:integrase
MSKLTAKKVENTVPSNKEYKLHDGSGLFLRVRTSGAKSWIYSFSLPGNRRLIRMTIGALNNISLKEARNMLPGLRRLVSEGIDPRNARAARLAENSQAITMQILFDAWIEFVKIVDEVTSTWIKRHEDRWRLHLKKFLGNVLARDVTRTHLAAALDVMTRKGIREETRKALTTLNLMLDYGLTRHVIEHNPARMLKPKDFAASVSRPRDRALALSELRILWQALDESVLPPIGLAHTPTMTPVTATAIKLLILTGARRGEVAGMRWDELDFNLRTWHLSGKRTKNRKQHTIYLGKLAIDLINTLRFLTGDSSFVFNTGFNTNHIHTDSLTTALSRLKKRKNADNQPYLSVKSFTIHDLRRSAATAWGEHLKIKPHIIERMLNHQPLNKLIATHQRAEYSTEQKAAWLAWDEMVQHQIAHDPNNVVQIRNTING